jgi:UDP-glucose 4-epimerase
MIRKIFITGGLGLIGKELIKNLNDSDYELTVTDLKKQLVRYKDFIRLYKSSKVKFLECDITNLKKVVYYSKKQDCIIHLAAMLGVKNTETNIQKCWDTNTHGTENIVEACNINKVKKLIFSSSSEVYGESLTNFISEKNELLGRNIYACSKIAAENLILNNVIQNKNFNYTILRLFNTYGQGQVAKFFIPNVCKSIKENKEIIINGNGKQLRGYAYASDIAEAINLSIKNKISKNKIYNVGNSKEKYSLRAVLDVLKKIRRIDFNKVKYKKKFFKSDRTQNREIYKRVCNINKIKRELNYKPKISLRAGLEKVLSKKNIIYNN